jgi:uncharacterized membrane protein YgdD (TMEM256/DUF423 family)
MWWRIGAVLGMTGVMLGAFGAHALTQLTQEERLLHAWDTGAKYQLIHALAVMLVAVHPAKPKLAGMLFTVGVVLFSGSLYALALTGIGFLGAITPLGGLAFIAGWIALAAAPPGGILSE